MLRRLRRPAALIAPLVLLSALATACGSAQTVETGGVKGDAAYTLSGEVGTTPDVTWKDTLKADKADASVVTPGDGAALAAGDEVFVNYYVGDGYTQATALDTYTKDAFPLDLRVGSAPAAPQSQNPTQDQIARYLLDTFVSEQVKAGDTIGTRTAVTVNSSDVVGYSGASFGIGNLDGLLVVIDLNSAVLAGPDGTAQPRDPKLPTITQAKKLPAGLDFSDTPAPDGTLHVSTLIKGTGAPVEADDLIKVNYLGQVYDAAKPFDESYSKGTALTVPIGQGAVVKGWDQGLVGVPVGSRVLLEIPPALGYGKKGSGDTIPGGSTLYFIIDVLAAG